jgi:hypothetical protein
MTLTLLQVAIQSSKAATQQVWRQKVKANQIYFVKIEYINLDHRHLGSNPKLPLDISYPFIKFGVNRPK